MPGYRVFMHSGVSGGMTRGVMSSEARFGEIERLLRLYFDTESSFKDDDEAAVELRRVFASNPNFERTIKSEFDSALGDAAFSWRLVEDRTNYGVSSSELEARERAAGIYALLFAQR